MRDQQHALRRLPDDDRLARLPRSGDGRRAGHGSGCRSTADDLRKAIGWAETENKRAGSPLNGKIAARSCRGHGSVMWRVPLDRTGLGSTRRYDRRIQLGSAGDNIARLAALHGPVLLINGHERDFLMASSKATFDAIEKLPAFYGARHGAGHTATVDHPAAASARTSPPTGSAGSSRATRRQGRCSSARTAASGRIRLGHGVEAAAVVSRRGLRIDSMALTPGTRLGSFEISVLIGVGGMGEVYRATETDLERLVAIEVLLDQCRVCRSPGAVPARGQDACVIERPEHRPD